MSALPFAFTYAPILLALFALPLIWLLLRVTPPRPRTESFPPTRLLLEIARKDEQPARTPWWLILLRCLIAAAIIVALAGPIYKPSTEEAPGDGALLVVVDNGWAAAPNWGAIVDTTQRVIRLAEAESRPVALMATAEEQSQDTSPTDAATAIERLEALEPRPFDPNYAGLIAALDTAIATAGFGGAVWLSDGLGGERTDAFASALEQMVPGPLLVYAGNSHQLALYPPISAPDALVASVTRADPDQPAAGFVRATDLKGRSIGDFPFDFTADESTAEARIELPVELRNEIARLEIVSADTAGAVQLLDDRWQRRRIGLLSGADADDAQPLLSPLYYIARAAQPFADIDQPPVANTAVAVPELIEAGTSVIAMADIGTLQPELEEAVAQWVADGGTLIRFAGPHLATATDSLVPVRLRQGDRVLGGSMTWEEEQPLASFAEASPFAGMDVPDDILVKRQVLAEPDGTLSERTWAALADGTPLVTGAPLGRGWLVLFHVTADTSWSNLPLSGSFVEMLRRIVAFSSGAVGDRTTQDANGGTLAPFRVLDGFGRSTTPGIDARPISASAGNVVASAEHPPGLYGTEEGFRAVNLVEDGTALSVFDPSVIPEATVQAYPTEAPTDLRPWILAFALGLFLIDALVMLWLNGAFRRRRMPAAAAILLAASLTALSTPSDVAQADEASDQFALDAVSQTRLAYVITGNDDIDEASRAGLYGLSQVLAERTALEPGDPVGLDPSSDELAFFPLLYWPIDPEGPLPSSATMARVDAYMRQGGSVVFDTRDQLERSTNLSAFSGTPAVERLRQMLSNLDVPPLEPVPADHVLTKAFYLLNDFPGRYAGGPLWVEATADAQDRADRPAQAGDGVSSILITENDLASAWAMSPDGTMLYPTIPSDPLQREMAFRTGVNIVMYTLTGNYKADQVHVPALLERLGQ